MFKNLMAMTLVLGSLSLAGTAQADPIPGPLWAIDDVQAYSSVEYHVSIYGNETTAIKIQGDGDTDLDLFVYDEYGNLLAVSDSYSDRETVFVTPSRNMTIRIVVRNLGNVYNRMRIDVW